MKRLPARVWKCLPIVLAAIPLAFLIAAIVRYAVELPFWDQWALATILDKSYLGTLSFYDFWAQHNEHRLVFPKLIMLALARISGWNVLYEMATSVLLAVGILAVFACQTQTTFRAAGYRRPTWLVPVLSLIVFSLAQHENWLWGWQLQIFLSVLAVVTGIALLANPVFTWSRFALAIAVGVVATYSFANGLTYWFVGLLVLVFWSQNRKASIPAWTIATSLTAGSYLYQYHNLAHHPSLWAAIERPEAYVRYVLGYLGAPVAGFSLRHAPVAGLLGLVAFSGVVWLLMRRGHRLRVLIPYIALVLYALASAMMTGVGRVGFGSDQAFSPRYVTISSVFWLSLAGLLYLLAITNRSRDNSRLLDTAAKWGSCLGLIAVAVLVILSSIHALDAIKFRRGYLLEARDALMSADDSPGRDELLERLFPNANYVKRQLAVVKKHGLSVFRRFITFCAPDGEGCVALAHHKPGGSLFQQGYPVPVTLMWLAQDVPTTPVRIRLRVIHDPWMPWLESASIVSDTLVLLECSDGGAQPREETGSAEEVASPETVPIGPFQVMMPLVLHTSPAPEPVCSDLLTLPPDLTLPLDAPTGPALVTLEVLGADDRVWPVKTGDASIPLFRFTIEDRIVLDRLPRGVTAFDVDLGDEIGLRGHRVEGDARPGGEIRITYVWYARERPTAIYAVFNHLMGLDGAMIAQVDGWPLEGRLLTTQWRAGEYVEDSYVVTIPPDADPGPYALYMGIYDAATGTRQPAYRDGRPLPEGMVPIPLPGEADQ